ncbi:HPP family protein [Methanosphaera cuniculi]|uniref:CBS domain-containing protein n=1 Tax=Methanosphaera cuniculi TaxID=1077256 RepID=UPI0026F24664|nr:CBS domain-containing protein [Methanosphaera cuniculi]
MIVKDMMNTNIYTIKQDAPLKDAIDKLQELDIGRLFVEDDDNKIVGQISNSDLIELMIPNEVFKIDDVKVSDVMCEIVNTIYSDSSIEDAANLMLRAETSGLLVCEDGKNVGVVTKTDLCRMVSMSDVLLRK